MNAHDLAARLRLERAARSWRGDCPCCAYPRAFSLRAGRNDAARMFCANGCAGEALHGAIGLITGEIGGMRTRPDAQRIETARARRQASALRLWHASRPAAGTLADIYLTARALPGLAASPALRFHPAAPHPERTPLPAMIALVTDQQGAPLAVHRTYLAADGRGKATTLPDRASLGPVWGGAIRLAEPAPGNAPVIGEGIESAASAGCLIGLPAWAALSAGNLARGLILPAAVRRVVIALDPDPAGEAAARQAAERWQREGRQVQLARPTIGDDFNDTLRARAAGAVDG